MSPPSISPSSFVISTILSAGRKSSGSSSILAVLEFPHLQALLLVLPQTLLSHGLSRIVFLQPIGGASRFRLDCAFRIPASPFGKPTGIALIDSITLTACEPRRAHSHRVFRDIAQWGKTSTGWFFGFKVHSIINDQGELLAVKLTAGNVDDRKPDVRG